MIHPAGVSQPIVAVSAHWSTHEPATVRRLLYDRAPALAYSFMNVCKTIAARSYLKRVHPLMHECNAMRLSPTFTLCGLPKLGL
jgi:hypothetical protein